MDLAALNAAQCFSIAGIDPDDLSGYAVSSAGDINGDGFDDLLIGAQGADLPDFYSAGEAYVVYGGAGLSHIDLATLTPDQGFRLSGTADNDAIGRSVSAAGDINGDGIDDFMVAGVRGTHAKAFIVYGQEDGFSDIDLTTFTPAQGFTVTGTSDFDSGGFDVARAGDVNGDGFEDIILGDSSARQIGRHYSGETYVIYGGAGDHSDVDLDNLLPTQGFRISGANEYDFSGRSVSSAGDINGDGFDDILIGAPDIDPSGRTDAGAAYVIYGNGAPADIDLRLLTTEQGFKITGADDQFFAGAEVSAAGDLNHDGFADLLVGVPGADVDGGVNAGQAFVIYGRDFGGSPLTMADLLDAEPPPQQVSPPAVTLFPGTPQIPSLEIDAA
jgi:hypothetical protein